MPLDIGEQIQSMLKTINDQNERRRVKLLELTGGDDSYEALSAFLVRRKIEHLLKVVKTPLTVSEFARIGGLHDRYTIDHIRSRQVECAECPAYGGRCVHEGPSASLKEFHGKQAVYVAEEHAIRHQYCARWPRFQIWQRMKFWGIPLRYRELKLQDYIPRNSTQEQALKASVDYVEHYSPTAPGLMFQGPPGVGKTHLAAAVLRELYLRHKISSATFAYTQSFIDKLHYQQDREEREAFMHNAITTGLLALDDLSVATTGEFERNQLTTLVTERAAEGAPWLITTNDAIDTLRERLGPRVVSRIGEATVCLKIDGDDYRIQKRPPSEAKAAASA